MRQETGLSSGTRLAVDRTKATASTVAAPSARPSGADTNLTLSRRVPGRTRGPDDLGIHGSIRRTGCKPVEPQLRPQIWELAGSRPSYVPAATA
jgi:hypothetical protein